MREHGFTRKLAAAEDVEWITASDAERPPLIIKALLAREPDFFKNQLPAYQMPFTEQTRLALAKAALEVCEPLKIYSLYNTMLYFWMSLPLGIYFHRDMRLGNNISMMQDFSISAPERIQRLYRQCLEVKRKIYITKDSSENFFYNAIIRFMKLDIPASLPMRIDGLVKFVEGWCRILWPEFIDNMPEHYFQLMAMPMTVFCDKHGLGAWELMLCLFAAPAIGCFFLEDPRYSEFRAMLLDKTGPQGRDKAINILVTAQNWLKSFPA